MKKTRELNEKVSFNAVGREQWNGYDPNWAPASSRTWKGTQVTESEGHRKSRDGKYREGGPFFTARMQASIPTRHIHAKSWHVEPHIIDGPICCNVPIDMRFLEVPQSSSKLPSLDQYGADAIAAVNPMNSNAQLGVDLGELIVDRKISVPGIQAWKKRTEVAKAAASEYLSAQFGWLPLVRDMKDTAQSVKDGNTIMENYHSNSGKDTHREFEFPPETSESEEVVKINTNAIYSASVSIGPTFDTNDASVSCHRKSSTRRWFSGAFTYAAGNDQSSLARCLGIGSEADKLFGLRLTPDVVWELTPWSWAIDWFSNAGNVISNATAFGLAGLVMRYGYIMEETSIVDTYTMSGTGLYGVGGTVPPATVTYSVKRRSEANPFGFGLSWDGLSPAQLAITAALGITRLR